MMAIEAQGSSILHVSIEQSSLVGNFAWSYFGAVRAKLLLPLPCVQDDDSQSLASRQAYGGTVLVYAFDSSSFEMRVSASNFTGNYAYSFRAVNAGAPGEGR